MQSWELSFLLYMLIMVTNNSSLYIITIIILPGFSITMFCNHS